MARHGACFDAPPVLYRSNAFSARSTFGRARRGFTMVELLAVIAVVGLLAAASAPSFIHFLRDRRVADAGAEIANTFRYARARAMGRGTAVDVRYRLAPDALDALDPANPNARLVVREAILGGLTNQARLGTPNCLGTDWSSGGTNSMFIAMFDERRPRYEPASLQFRDPANAVVAGDVDICFTPRGRVWVNYDGGGFNPIAGVPYIDVLNADSGMLRRVIIPPSGAARLITEI